MWPNQLIEPTLGSEHHRSREAARRHELLEAVKQQRQQRRRERGTRRTARRTLRDWLAA
jgi:hypothetical protein